MAVLFLCRKLTSKIVLRMTHLFREVILHNSIGAWKGIGAGRNNEFVDIKAKAEKRRERKEETKTVIGNLKLNLHVGTEGSSDNKIEVVIEAMSAEGIGIDSLRSKEGGARYKLMHLRIYPETSEKIL